MIMTLREKLYQKNVALIILQNLKKYYIKMFLFWALQYCNFVAISYIFWISEVK